MPKLRNKKGRKVGKIATRKKPIIDIEFDENDVK